MNFPVFYLNYASKTPIKGCNWRDPANHFSVSDIDTSKFGVGLPLGEASGLVCLDLDEDIDDLHCKILSIAGISPVVKKGEKGCNHFYKYNGERKQQYTKNGVCVLDLLGEGSYTVLPPSIHPNTKQPYKYIGQDTLGNIDVNKLHFLPTDFKEQLDELFGKVKPKLKIYPTPKEGVGLFYNTSKKDIEEALTHISPNGYEDWINVGMALKSTDIEDSDAFGIWDCWSYDGDTYNCKEMESKWTSFTEREGGITIATLFKMAIDNRYKGLKAVPEAKSHKETTQPTDELATNPLYSISKAVAVINNWKKNGYPVGEYIGVPEFEGESGLDWHLRKGEMTVVTGYPGDGKSEFVNFMTYNAAKLLGYRTLSFSFEETSTAHMVESYMTKFCGKTIRNRSSKEDEDSVKFIEKHLEFYDHVKMGNKIEDMMALCEKMKDKIDIIVIDTFSNIRSEYGCSEGDMNHVKHTVQLVSRTCKKLNIHCFFVAHPTKDNNSSSGGFRNIDNRPTPSLNMVSGGAIWNNIANNGMVIRREGNNARITLCKIKDQNFGDCKGEVVLAYDKNSRSFKSINNQF